MIPFNSPPHTGNEDQYVLDAMRSSRISGDGRYGRDCQAWFERRFGFKKTLLTPSCTHALEMAALLIGISPGDEVIMPSFTFVSTANAFALRGARIVFVDIRPDTMNVDASLIESAITPLTKAIVPVHYAGVSCEMDLINDIAHRHNLFVIEDAAQGIMSTYKGKPLGGLGHLAAISFHETKNISSGGEGGLLIINDEQFIERAEVIREKGTNRSQFFRGEVNKYNWVDLGSSYLPSELQSSFLWGQLEKAEQITSNRIATWKFYRDSFLDLESAGKVELPSVAEDWVSNGHLFYIKCKNLCARTSFLEHMKANGILAVSHYVPLHSAPAGGKFSRFHGNDRFTTAESERLVRLPLFYGMTDEVKIFIVTKAKEFFS